jgi:hypothetical protein
LTSPRPIEWDGPVLDRIAGELSQRWVEGVLEALIAQDRSLEGGWPGTTSEARQIASAWVRNQPATRASLPEQREHLEQLTKAVYDAAKKEWLSQATSLRSTRRQGS